MIVAELHIDSFAIYNAFDPTRTTTLRKAFVGEMNRRFNELIGVVTKAVVELDVFGIGQQRMQAYQMTTPNREAFAFLRNDAKLAAFMRWLQEQVNKGMLDIREFEQIGESIEKSWQNKYLFDSYKRGVIRARQELRNAGYDVPTIEETGGIEITLSTPFHIDRLGLIYTRAYNELKGVTTTMETQISRILAQGLADGDGPRLLARKLVSSINGADAGELGITDTLGRFIPAKRRAELIARTEMIRAHHLATVQEYRNWAAEGVVVQAEWMTAGDNRVCAKCESLQGEIFTLDQIERMIPAHPACRCIALPFKEGMEKIKRGIR